MLRCDESPLAASTNRFFRVGRQKNNRFSFSSIKALKQNQGRKKVQKLFPIPGNRTEITSQNGGFLPIRLQLFVKHYTVVAEFFFLLNSKKTVIGVFKGFRFNSVDVPKY